MAISFDLDALRMGGSPRLGAIVTTIRDVRVRRETAGLERMRPDLDAIENVEQAGGPLCLPLQARPVRPAPQPGISRRSRASHLRSLSS